MDDKTLLIRTEEKLEADVIVSKLQESGIKCWVLNKKDSSYLTFGFVEIFVNHEDKETAESIISIE